MIIKKNGKNLDGVKDLFAKLLALHDGEYWVEIKENRPTRSQLQNRYYWGVVVKTLADELGYLSDEMHQILAKKFLSYEKNGYTFVMSTTQLNTKEFEEYMSKVRYFASADLSIWIPEPNEENYIKEF